MTIFSEGQVAGRRPGAADAGKPAENGPLPMDQAVAATFTIHSEARGPHWVAWITAAGESRPYQSLVLVGATRQEAEDKAREWAARVAAQATRSSSMSSPVS